MRQWVLLSLLQISMQSVAKHRYGLEFANRSCAVNLARLWLLGLIFVIVNDQTLAGIGVPRIVIECPDHHCVVGGRQCEPNCERFDLP